MPYNSWVVPGSRRRIALACDVRRLHELEVAQSSARYCLLFSRYALIFFGRRVHAWHPMLSVARLAPRCHLRCRLGILNISEGVQDIRPGTGGARRGIHAWKQLWIGWGIPLGRIGGLSLSSATTHSERQTQRVRGAPKPPHCTADVKRHH